MTEPPQSDDAESRHGATSPTLVGRAKSWPRSTQVLAALSVVLAIALVVSLIALGTWRDYSQDLSAQRSSVEEDRESIEAELAEVQGELAEAEAELEAVRDLEEELAEREDALNARAEELDAVEEVEEQRQQAEGGDMSVGSTTTFDEWEITLVDVETHGPINRSSPRGKYVVLLLDVTNNASHEREFLGIGRGFNLLDVENDREYTFDTSASLDYHQTFDTDAWYLEDLGPGLSGRIPVAIDVGEDTSWGLTAMTTSSGVSDPWFIEDL